VGEFIKRVMLPFAQLARSAGLRWNIARRGGAVPVLLGITAFGAYSVGRQSAPVSNAPVSAVLAQPVAFIGPAAQVPAPVPTIPSSSSGPTTRPSLPDKPAAPDTKRKVEAGLTENKKPPEGGQSLRQDLLR
jgi:hypothetical protein